MRVDTVAGSHKRSGLRQGGESDGGLIAHQRAIACELCLKAQGGSAQQRLSFPLAMSPARTRRALHSSGRISAAQRTSLTTVVVSLLCLGGGHADPTGFGLGKTPQMGWNR